MTTTQTTTTADRAAALLSDADYVGLTELYAPDVVVDLHTPKQRVTITNRADAQTYVREAISRTAALRTTSAHRTDTADGVVVEVECHFDDDGDVFFRAVELLTISDGAIARHTEYCTGNWTGDDVGDASA